MKKFVIGLLVIGLTSLGHSQNVNSEVEIVKLDDILLSNVNMDYLEKVQDKTISEPVRLLENKASRFNVTKLPEFDGRKESFKTIFKGSKGFIIAIYDNNGKILTTLERFRDVKLPRPVITTVLKKYPKWTFWKNSYFVSYHSDKGAQKVYRVQVRKGNMKKSLKIDSDGNII